MRPCVSLLVLIVVSSSGYANALVAQGRPGVAPMAGGSGYIQITPDGTYTPQHPSNTSGYSQVFTVKNNFLTPVSFELLCFGRVNVTCTDLDIVEMTLEPGEQRNTAATYGVGAPGTGRVVVKALGHADSGYYRVPVVLADPPGPPAITLRHHNGDHRDRSLCLTAGAGEAAAWQCGDLLVAHGLPGYATLGRDRTLTLLYNSAQALPRPVVAISVNQGGIAPPNEVFVKLSVNGAARDSASFSGWTGGTRQLVLPLNGSSDSSGIYPFMLQVQNRYPANYETSVSDSLIVVNRANSLYGAGWSLAGVEELRLNQPGGKVLWVGGDGSAKVYRPVATDTLVGAAGGYRDTLVRFDSAGVSLWRRTLRHGIAVTYRVTGSPGVARHVRTTNRVGRSTAFTWSGDTLKTIAVPPGTWSNTVYTLSYASGRLDKITDPVGRILDVAVVANRLTQILDPDGAYPTEFSYDAAGRMTGRTNRRGFTTTYVYSKGLRVDTVKVRLDTVAATFAITSFRPWDQQGLATGLTGQVAVDTALANTKIDGPRAGAADTAAFWLDRWGAPVRLRNPLGHLTTLTRGDAAFPALVTRIALPDSRILGSGYNARGNLAFSTDSTYQGSGTTQTITTSYVYGDSRFPDAPTLVRGPVDTLAVTYDTLGLPSVYTAQGGHQTQFTYFASGAHRGLLNSVTENGVPVVDTVAWTEANANLTTAFGYDTLGNVVTTQSPKGLTTTYGRDGYTRVRYVWDPAGHRTDYAFDVLNRVDAVTVYDDPQLNGPKETRYRYTASGQVDRVLDDRDVARTWAYDAAGRGVRETDDVGNDGYSYLNPAGFVDSAHTRNGHVIRHTHDPAGRLTQTIYPANQWAAGDTILRSYDAGGRLRTITSRNAIDSLWYNLEGSVKIDRQIVRNDVKTVMFDVTLRYWYDAGGRRTKFFNGVDTIRYTYGTDGQLAKLRVDWMTGGLAADSFQFTFDALGRRDRVVYTNGTDVTLGYDRDGHLRMICAKHPGGDAGVGDHLEQRLWYSSLDLDGQVVAMSRRQGVAETASCGSGVGTLAELHSNSTYDGRHQLTSRGGLNNEAYEYDASGNITSKSIGVETATFVIAPASNRLLSGTINGGNRVYTHDPSGNRVRDSVPGSLNHTRKFFYNAIGQTVGDSAYWLINSQFQWVGDLGLFRYDAQGRRVRLGGVHPFDFVFDGDNVVGAWSGATAWRYIHGPGLDDPLVAAYNPNTPWTEKYYYLTDGRGRQLAFTDTAGVNYQGLVEYTNRGGSHAGGITKSNGFDNERSGAQEAPRLSYYRHRYYDQETGRWTQEDPIGLAGGVNLYQFSGNNPLSFTDPFGLSPCDDLREKIDDALHELQGDWFRYQKYLAKGTADAGHFEELEGRRRGLARDTEDYKSKCGGDDDDQKGHRAFQPTLDKAVKWSTVPIRQPQLPKRSRSMAYCWPTEAGIECGMPYPYIPGFNVAPGVNPAMPRLPAIPLRMPTPVLVP